MGYITKTEFDEVHLPSNAEYFVRLKRKAAYGDTLAAQSAMFTIGAQTSNGQAGVGAEANMGSYMRTLLTRLIVEWNLDDEQGVLLPITEESIDLLAAADGDFLSAEVQKRAGGRPDAQQNPFPTPSGALSTATTPKTAKPHAR